MLMCSGEFFVARGFWFFFPEKKNKQLLVQRAIDLPYQRNIPRQFLRTSIH